MTSSKVRASGSGVVIMCGVVRCSLYVVGCGRLVFVCEWALTACAMRPVGDCGLRGAPNGGGLFDCRVSRRRGQIQAAQNERCGDAFRRRPLFQIQWKDKCGGPSTSLLRSSARNDGLIRRAFAAADGGCGLLDAVEVTRGPVERKRAGERGWRMRLRVLWMEVRVASGPR